MSQSCMHSCMHVVQYIIQLLLLRIMQTLYLFKAILQNKPNYLLQDFRYCMTFIDLHCILGTCWPKIGPYLFSRDHVLSIKTCVCVFVCAPKGIHMNWFCMTGRIYPKHLHKTVLCIYSKDGCGLSDKVHIWKP